MENVEQEHTLLQEANLGKVKQILLQTKPHELTSDEGQENNAVSVVTREKDIKDFHRSFGLVKK